MSLDWASWIEINNKAWESAEQDQTARMRRFAYMDAKDKDQTTQERAF